MPRSQNFRDFFDNWDSQEAAETTQVTVTFHAGRLGFEIALAVLEMLVLAVIVIYYLNKKSQKRNDPGKSSSKTLDLVEVASVASGSADGSTARRRRYGQQDYSYRSLLEAASDPSFEEMLLMVGQEHDRPGSVSSLISTREQALSHPHSRSESSSSSSRLSFPQEPHPQQESQPMLVSADVHRTELGGQAGSIRPVIILQPQRSSLTSSASSSSIFIAPHRGDASYNAESDEVPSRRPHSTGSVPAAGRSPQLSGPRPSSYPPDRQAPVSLLLSEDDVEATEKEYGQYKFA